MKSVCIYILSLQYRVEYTDFLGRSRRCMKKDLEGMKKIDNEMNRQKVSERKQTSRCGFFVCMCNDCCTVDHLRLICYQKI